MSELTRLMLQIVTTRAVKRFRTPNTIHGEANADAMLGKLMLVVSEVAEAAEAVRHGDQAAYEEELADTFIRLLDICGTQGIDPLEIISRKVKTNNERPTRHGKLTTL